MVRALDPRVVPTSSTRMRTGTFQEDLSGIYGGAGFQVEYRGGAYEVVGRSSTRPAERLDIQGRDASWCWRWAGGRCWR
jgi:hypothetical protein